MFINRTISRVLFVCVSALVTAAGVVQAEQLPSLDDLASDRMLLIVDCRAEEYQGRVLYKVLDVWKGQYNPTAFAKQPPTGYIDTIGPEGGASARKPGQRVILVYTVGNQSKQGIDRHDMTIPVREDGAMVYPPGYEGLPGQPGKIGQVIDFKREITSRVRKHVEKPAQQAAVAPAVSADLTGMWRMFMPGGFEHGATLEKAGENRFRLMSGATRLNGVYERRGDQLVAVEPADTASEGYVWQVRSNYMLTLVKHAEDIGNDYRGTVLFRAKAAAVRGSPPAAGQLSDDLSSSLAHTPIVRGAKIEYLRGFRTLQPADLQEYWNRAEPKHKLQGQVTDHVDRNCFASFWMLQVNIAIVAPLHRHRLYPTLEDELLAFIAPGNEFLTGPLPERIVEAPHPHLVAMFRTKDDLYGLLTRYPGYVVLEMGGRIGIAAIPAEAKASK